jgi:hypothetical protein
VRDIRYATFERRKVYNQSIDFGGGGRRHDIVVWI